MNSRFEQVIASYHRARQSDQLFDTFYRIFLGKSAEIPKMFVHTDFPHQKRMLKQSLLEMLLAAESPHDCDEIQRLAQMHVALNVKPEFYNDWLDALCEALAVHDPQLTPELEQSWRDAMRPGIEVMISGGTPPMKSHDGSAS